MNEPDDDRALAREGAAAATGRADITVPGFDETCDFMDEAPGHRATDHEPHQAEQSGERTKWKDGDETRLGYICVVCRHVADYGDGPRLYHTDPRLDRVAS